MTCPTLPPELLGIIFKLVAIEHPFLTPSTMPCSVPTHPRTDRGPIELVGPQCDECRTTFSLGWFSVTHVCRRWRDAAYATYSLWTEINNYMPLPAVEVCLECSRGQTLSLFIGRHRHVLTHPNQDWIWPGAVLEEEELARIAFIFCQAHLRIRKLVTTRDLLRRMIPILTQSPLHNVQSINLLFCDKLNENSTGLIASLQPHCLRELSLDGLIIQWTKPGTLWPDIVASSLHSLVCDGVGYTPLVIRGLRGLRSLKFLRVHKMSGNMQDIEAAISGTAIELPDCQEIDLDGLDGQVAGFLNALHLRPDVRLRIRSSLWGLYTQTLPPTVAAFRAHLSRPDGRPTAPLRTVTFHHDSSFTWRLCASSRVESAAGFDLDVTYRDTALMIKSSYDDLFGLPPMIADNIISLHLPLSDYGVTIGIRQFLRRNFSSFTSLEFLRVCGTEIIAQAVEDLLPQPDDAPLFPVLRELVLADLPFWMLSAEYEELGLKLLVMFNARRDAGVPIRVLQVSDGEMMMHGRAVWDELSRLVTVRIAQDT